jgi:hypothetical protein
VVNSFSDESLESRFFPRIRSACRRRVSFQFDSINSSLADNEPPRSTDMDQPFVTRERVIHLNWGLSERKKNAAALK